MQPWMLPVIALLALAVVVALSSASIRHRERAADVRYVALLRGQDDLMRKLKALEQELDTARVSMRNGEATVDAELAELRVSMRNGQEAMVVLSEQLGMEFGELRTLLTPKPAARKPAARKPAAPRTK